MAKKRTKWNIKKFLRNIIVLAILIFLVYSIYINITQPKSDVFQVTFENVALETEHRAIIMRNEFVVKSVNTGVFTPLVADGERIKKNQLVGKLTVAEHSKDNDNDKNSNADIIIVDEDGLKTEINVIYSELVKTVKSKSYIRAKTLKSALNMKLERLDKLIASKSDSAYNIKESKNNTVGNKDAGIGQVININSHEAGILTYYFDGFEDSIRFENRYKIDYNQLFEKQIIAENKSAATVMPNKGIFKIVSGVVWYLACEVALEDFERFSAGANVDVTMQGQTITGKIDDVFEANGKGIMVIEINQQTDGMHNTRTLNITLKRDEVRGLKLPKTALVERAKAKGVYTVDLNKKIHFLPIEILADLNDFVVVQEDTFKYKNSQGEIETVYTLKHGDKVVDNALKYKEGDIVE